MPDIPLWKYVVGGTMTALAIFWPMIQKWWAERKFSKVVPVHPTSAGSDDTPDPIIAEWAKQVTGVTAGSTAELQMQYILQGKTLMEIVRLERDRLLEEKHATTIEEKKPAPKE